MNVYVYSADVPLMWVVERIDAHEERMAPEKVAGQYRGRVWATLGNATPSPFWRVGRGVGDAVMESGEVGTGSRPGNDVVYRKDYVLAVGCRYDDDVLGSVNTFNVSFDVV